MSKNIKIALGLTSIAAGVAAVVVGKKIMDKRSEKVVELVVDPEELEAEEMTVEDFQNAAYTKVKAPAYALALFVCALTSSVYLCKDEFKNLDDSDLKKKLTALFSIGACGGLDLYTYAIWSKLTKKFRSGLCDDNEMTYKIFQPTYVLTSFGATLVGLGGLSIASCLL